MKCPKCTYLPLTTTVVDIKTLEAKHFCSFKCAVEDAVGMKEENRHAKKDITESPKDFVPTARNLLIPLGESGSRSV